MFTYYIVVFENLCQNGMFLGLFMPGLTVFLSVIHLSNLIHKDLSHEMELAPADFKKRLLASQTELRIGIKKVDILYPLIGKLLFQKWLW